MGNVTARNNQRTAPARYVAKQLPRVPADVEEEFAKAKLTIQGINKMKEKVSTTPQPYVETKGTDESTPLTDMSAPRWYMNTWMELMDNTRQDRAIVSGALPISWNRDHNEPYSLVRNRIDDEDLDWLLSEGKKLPIEELLQHTKLERESLEDILATVDAPKKQYRNYQGKIHRAIENTNTFMADRQKRVEENRNEELLRQIGYSDEELEDEKQYMTNRSRGVKTLDDLGVSIRRKKRLERFSQQNDMEILLEERRLQAIEAGTYEPTEEELQRPEAPGRVKGAYYKARFSSHKNQLRMDMANSDKEQATREKIADWLDARKNIEYGKDKFPEEHTPVYHEILSQTEEQAKAQLEQDASKSQVMARGQGKKQWADPRQQYDTMLKIMRDSSKSRDGVTREVEEQQNAIRDAAAAFDAKQENKTKETMELEKARQRAQEKFGSPDLDRVGYIPRIERQLMREAAAGSGVGIGQHDAASKKRFMMNEPRSSSSPPAASSTSTSSPRIDEEQDDMTFDPRTAEQNLAKKQQQQQQQQQQTSKNNNSEFISMKNDDDTTSPSLPKQPGGRGFSSRWPAAGSTGKNDDNDNNGGGSV